jgi:hypothetical protein
LHPHDADEDKEEDQETKGDKGKEKEGTGDNGKEKKGDKGKEKEGEETKPKVAVEGSISKFIEKVVYELHPTFFPPTVTVTEPPYEVARLGWGYFSITVNIHWKNGRVSKFKHKLNFESDRTEKEHDVVLL